MRNYRLLGLIGLFICQVAYTQNIGIGTTTPQEKLDVNGNLNISGTIKANGVAGQPGQVLRTNNSGNLEWANFSQYPNFTTVSTGVWVVPAGVTKILVEGWGGGGGGCNYAGGGGGGYVLGLFDATPGGYVSISVGYGGSSGGFAGNNGQSTTITVGTNTIEATGGGGATFNSTAKYVDPGQGGSFGGEPLSRYSGLDGGPGSPSVTQYMQAGSTIYEATYGGCGGEAGNSPGSGGIGGYTLNNLTTSTLVRTANPVLGTRGSGGGAGNVFSAGGSGMFGSVVIHY